MTDSPPQSATLRDMTCGTCGYNLRGLSPDGRCPECGHPIEESRYDPRLAAADPRWLRAIRRGFTLLLASELVMASMRFLLHISTVANWSRESLVVLWFISCGLYLPGTWIVASRDRVCPPMFDPRHLRRAVRVCAVVASIGTFIVAIEWSVNRLPAHLSVSVLALMILGLLGTACMFLLLRGFARRIPVPALALATTGLLWFVPTVAGLRLGQDAVYALLLATGHPNADAVYGSPVGSAICKVLEIADWISLGASAVVFFWFRRRLSAVLARARETTVAAAAGLR